MGGVSGVAGTDLSFTLSRQCSRRAAHGPGLRSALRPPGPVPKAPGPASGVSAGAQEAGARAMQRSAGATPLSPARPRPRDGLPRAGKLPRAGSYRTTGTCIAGSPGPTPFLSLRAVPLSLPPPPFSPGCSPAPPRSRGDPAAATSLDPAPFI